MREVLWRALHRTGTLRSSCRRSRTPTSRVRRMPRSSFFDSENFPQTRPFGALVTDASMHGFLSLQFVDFHHKDPTPTGDQRRAWKRVSSHLVYEQSVSSTYDSSSADRGHRCHPGPKACLRWRHLYIWPLLWIADSVLCTLSLLDVLCSVLSLYYACPCLSGSSTLD